MKHKDFLIGLLQKLTETDFIPLEYKEVKKVKEILEELSTSARSGRFV